MDETKSKEKRSSSSGVFSRTPERLKPPKNPPPVSLPVERNRIGGFVRVNCLSCLIATSVAEARKAEGKHCVYIPEISGPWDAFSSRSVRCADRLLCNHLELMICHVRDQVLESPCTVCHNGHPLKTRIFDFQTSI